VQVTPAIIRLRKRILDASLREQFSRAYARSIKDLEEA
jgi:predicted membrane GTPase involved in stress response